MRGYVTFKKPSNGCTFSGDTSCFKKTFSIEGASVLHCQRREINDVWTGNHLRKHRFGQCAGKMLDVFNDEL